MRNRAIAVFLLCFVLVSVGSYSPIQQVWPGDTLSSAATPSQGSPPITIAGDTELSRESTGGAGTRSDPYILSGLTITALGGCIYIADTTAFFVIRDCVLESTGAQQAVITFSRVENGTIEGCYLAGGPIGVRFAFCTDCTVEESTVTASDEAISIADSYNCTVRDCTIHSNIVGVLVGGSEGSLIVGCSVYRNSDSGVQIDSYSEGTSVYQNDIGWNGWTGVHYSNAFDAGNGTRFTDGIDSGNAWSDYNGSAPYNIPGPAASTDTFATLLTDTVSPDIDSPLDKIFDVESTGETVTWIATDNLPYSYLLIIDDIPHGIEIWDGREITVFLDELTAGTHVLVLNVTDGANNVASDEVTVTAVSFLLGGLGTEWVLWGSILTVVILILVIAVIKRT